MEMLNPAIISTVAIAVSITTFFAAKLFSNIDRRSDLTISLWRIWDDKEMRHKRLTAWRSIIDQHGNIPDEGAVVFSNSDSMKLDALNDVEHYLTGLSVLMRKRKLDSGLYKNLLLPRIKEWRSLSLAVHRDNSGRLKSKAEIKILYHDLVNAG